MTATPPDPEERPTAAFRIALGLVLFTGIVIFPALGLGAWVSGIASLDASLWMVGKAEMVLALGCTVAAVVEGARRARSKMEQRLSWGEVLSAVGNLLS